MDPRRVTAKRPSQLPLPIDLVRRYRGQTYFTQIWALGHRLHRAGVPLLPKAIDIFCRVVFSADVTVRANIGDQVVFMHNGMGTAIHTKVVIEGPGIVFQNVTIGESMGLRPGTPSIGRKVVIGAGAVIIGPVTVGEGSIIGANAVVVRDVPPHSLAVGNPAEIRPVNRRLVDSHFDEPEASAETPQAA